MKTLPTSLVDTLEAALKHYADPTWLGEHSPLAAPYLLGKQLEQKLESPLARGKVLRDRLKQATLHITGKYVERSQAIIQEYYFRDLPVEIVAESIGLSKAAFHTSRKAAIADLADALVAELQPALALELPPQVQDAIFEQEEALAQCFRSLQNKETVLVMGGGGMGKTTLGSRLAHLWGSKRVCWFTVRPGLNAHLGNLLLQLGYCFREQGVSVLWGELIATQGKINLEILPSLLRFTVQQLSQPLLLCVDEADLLQSGEHEAHGQLLTFLQSLRGLMPVLLIGQRVAMDTEHHVTLTGLTPITVKQWLLQQRIQLSEPEHQQLYAYTKGTPHLVKLFLMLHQVGEALPQLLQTLSAMPSLEFLLGRMLLRLTDQQRGLLMELAVIEGVAPADAWQQAWAGTLQLLMEYSLVQSDGEGGIWLLPLYRQTIASQLEPERLQELHERAAQLYAARGQYTIAAFHYARTAQPVRAIYLWRAYQQQEINVGQAHTALTIFRAFSADDLRPVDREALQLILAHLGKTVGSWTHAYADLQSILKYTSVLSVEAQELAGVIATELGKIAEAETHFQRALDIAGQHLDGNLARIHKGRGWAYLEEKELSRAWQEAQLAAYEAENFKGYVQEEACVYPEAETYFRQALDIAEAIGHEEGIAKTCNNLFGLYAKLGRFDDAHRYWQRADRAYRHLGKTLSIAGCQTNLIYLYNLSGKFEEALAAAKALERYLAERQLTVASRLQGIIDQCMAEAYLGLGDWANATHHAQAVVDREERRVLPDAYRVLAEAYLAQGKVTEAAYLASNAVYFAKENEDRYLEAYALRITGKIYQQLEQIETALQAWADATEIFTALQLPHEVARTLDYSVRLTE